MGQLAGSFLNTLESTKSKLSIDCAPVGGTATSIGSQQKNRSCFCSSDDFKYKAFPIAINASCCSFCANSSNALSKTVDKCSAPVAARTDSLLMSLSAS